MDEIIVALMMSEVAQAEAALRAAEADLEAAPEGRDADAIARWRSAQHWVREAKRALRDIKR